VATWSRVVAVLVAVIVGATIPHQSVAAPVLTRSAAATIIERSVEIQGRRSDMCLRLDWYARAKGLGLIANGQFAPPLAAYISQILGNCGAVLKQRVETPRVSVSGIADLSPTMKQAEFTWAYHALPAALRPLAPLGGYGNATFQLYDDGWRAVSVAVRNGDATYPTTAAEEAQIAAGNRQAAEMVAESKHNHRLILASPDNNARLGDAYLSIYDGGALTCRMWFGNIVSFEPVDDGDLRANYRIFGVDQTDVRDTCPSLSKTVIRFDDDSSRRSFLDAANRALADWRRRFPQAWLTTPPR